MLPLLISIVYAISIILVTFVLVAYRRQLKNYKYLLITLMWTYSLWKWLLLKVPEIKTMVWMSFWDSLLFWLILFSLIVLPFFALFEKYINEKELSTKDKRSMFWLFVLFLVFHTIPEAIQIWYQYTFGVNWNIWEVAKALIEEIPEFIMLLSIYIVIIGEKKSSIILWILTWLLFPITTLLVTIFATSANEALEMMTKNILLWFYIIFWIMSFNILLKYNKKYIILFIWIIVLFAVYSTIVWF